MRYLGLYFSKISVICIKILLGILTTYHMASEAVLSILMRHDVALAADGRLFLLHFRTGRSVVGVLGSAHLNNVSGVCLVLLEVRLIQVMHASHLARLQGD